MNSAELTLAARVVAAEAVPRHFSPAGQEALRSLRRLVGLGCLNESAAPAPDPPAVPDLFEGAGT